MKIIITYNNIIMVELEFDKENKIKFKYQDPNYKNIQREYRSYQKNYYYKKMGYDKRKILNWKGEKVNGLVIERGVFTIKFD